MKIYLKKAIQAVGEIIQEYDPTKRFPAYGFGARVPPSGTICHNFPLTFSESPYCEGIEGVLEAYRFVICHTLRFHVGQFDHWNK
jgi:hypothetical protein